MDTQPYQIWGAKWLTLTCSLPHDLCIIRYSKGMLSCFVKFSNFLTLSSSRHMQLANGQTKRILMFYVHRNINEWAINDSVRYLTVCNQTLFTLVVTNIPTVGTRQSKMYKIVDSFHNFWMWDFTNHANYKHCYVFASFKIQANLLTSSEQATHKDILWCGVPHYAGNLYFVYTAQNHKVAVHHCSVPAACNKWKKLTGVFNRKANI